jgi:hypothetical protein
MDETRSRTGLGVRRLLGRRSYRYRLTAGMLAVSLPIMVVLAVLLTVRGVAQIDECE